MRSGGAAIRVSAGMAELALYEPDIAGNTGTLIRLCVCLGTTLHIIEPAGFRMDDTALKRAGMDYIDLASVRRHTNWAAFLDWRDNRRLILLTTKAETAYNGIAYRSDDILLLGSESSGVPDHVHKTADLSVTIPMATGARSLNVAVAGAMVLGEAMRQTGGFVG